VKGGSCQGKRETRTSGGKREKKNKEGYHLPNGKFQKKKPGGGRGSPLFEGCGELILEKEKGKKKRRRGRRDRGPTANAKSYKLYEGRAVEE